ncbi:MAG: glycosyltransferase [Pelobium sp.]
MRIFLIDTTISGHHLSYLRLFAKAFIELQHQVTIISPATNEQILDDNFKESLSKLEVRTINDKLIDFQGGSILAFRKHIKHTWNWLKKAVDETIQLTDISPDLVFFSTIDPYLGPYTSKHEIDYYFPYPWSGLYMKPQHTIEKWKYGFLRKFLLNPNHILQSKNCKTIGIFVEPCAEKLFQIIKKPIIIFPDVVDDAVPDRSATIVKDILKQAKGRHIISLVGSLEKRKGIITLLKAAKKFSTDEFFFVFAGAISTSSFTKAELSLIDGTNLSNAFFFLNRIPNEGVFNGLISISTIVYASYINFSFSSNLIGKAALFNKPVLVTSESFMGSIVEKYKLGKSVQEGNVQEVYDEILNMATAEYLNFFKVNNGCAKYIAENNYLKFQDKLKVLLTNCQL